MKYFLTIILLFQTLIPTVAEEKQDSVTNLAEIVVKAKKEIRSGDHVSLYLSEENIRFGTNALDAISTLNRFTTSLNQSSLLSNLRKEVTILINGIPSSADQLRSYRADQIRYVDYYDVAPAKYRVFGEGPMINVRLKKQHDITSSVYLNTANAVSLPLGRNNLDLSFADSLNMIKAGYYIGYDKIGKIHEDTEYIYDDDSFTRNTSEMNRRRYLSQNVYASYQRSQGSNLLNIRAEYLWNNSRRTAPYNIEVGEGTNLFYGNGGKTDRQWNDNASLDIYYSHDFSAGKALNINIVGSYGRSGTYTSLYNDMPSQWDFLDYDISSHNINKVFSLVAYSGYVQKMLGGQFSASLRYQRGQIRRLSETGKIYRSETDEGKARVGMSWFGSSYMISPTIGVDIQHDKYDTIGSTSTLPSVDVFTQFFGTGLFRYFQLSFNGSVGQTGLPIASTLGNDTYIDRRFILRGNPDIKPFLYTATNISCYYYSPEGKHYCVLSVQSTYNHKPAVPLLFTENSMAIRQLNTINHTWQTQGYLGGLCKPLPWLGIQPYLQFFRWKYDTPSNHISRNYLRFGGGVIFTPGNWNIMLAANSASKSYNGDLVSRMSPQYSIIAMYRLKQWTFGAEWHYSAQNEYTKGQCDGFVYRSTTSQIKRRAEFMVDIIWSFSKGHFRKHPNKKVNNHINESGLDDAISIKSL